MFPGAAIADDVEPLVAVPHRLVVEHHVCAAPLLEASQGCAACAEHEAHTLLWDVQGLAIIASLDVTKVDTHRATPLLQRHGHEEASQFPFFLGADELHLVMADFETAATRVLQTTLNGWSERSTEYKNKDDNNDNPSTN